MSRRHSLVATIGLWLLKSAGLVLVWLVALVWSGLLAPRVLIRRDMIDFEPQDPGRWMPIDHVQTFWWCAGPAGWIMALGMLGLGVVAAALVYRWPWPLRVIVAGASPAWVLFNVLYASDLHPDIQPLMLGMSAAAVALAMLGALLCRPIVRLVVRVVWPPAVSRSPDPSGPLPQGDA